MENQEIWQEFLAILADQCGGYQEVFGLFSDQELNTMFADYKNQLAN